ncbi:hypothetical protein F4819DRAFT_277602 [Hypoxylon fuscum]|nr:hypothetical protein F4819DRAFT_277602 [Hypoxylon fuscum]
MANDSSSYFCGFFRRRATPAPNAVRSDGLQGVEFSPRSSFASSIGATRAPDHATSSHAAAASYGANINNPELTGYYSPPAPRPLVTTNPSQELRGYYAPEPVASPQPAVRPGKPTYS